MQIALVAFHRCGYILMSIEFHNARASTVMANGSEQREFYVSLGERIAHTAR
jgi:hypothetical protein